MTTHKTSTPTATPTIIQMLLLSLLGLSAALLTFSTLASTFTSDSELLVPLVGLTFAGVGRWLDS